MTNAADPGPQRPAGGDPGPRQPPAAIRLMVREDLDAVCNLELRSFASPWSRDAIERHAFGNPHTCYVVAEAQGVVVGYGGVWVAADEAHVVTLAVEKGFRRQGIGSRLLLALLLEARRRGATYALLEYRQSNEAAARLYARFGFQAVGVRRGYYRDTGEDAVTAVLRDLRGPQLDRFAAQLGVSPVVTQQT